MNFRLEYTPPALTHPVQYTEPLFLTGSCFTENIGAKFRQYRFRVLENPHGILFNPASIVKAMDAYMLCRKYGPEDLFYANECWNSWDHHSRFSHPDQSACLQQINTSIESAHRFLKTAGRVFITLGSAFAYEKREGGVVANCHKIPTDRFFKRLLSAGDIEADLRGMLDRLFAFNSAVQVIFTISPVRHLRDGFIENNRSKANLIQAVHALVEQEARCAYFPAYELVIDDLRDYRFYAEDMVHPNYAATNYVWEKLVSSCIDTATQDIMKQVNLLNAARSHKPFHPASQQHQAFLRTHLEKARALQERCPWLDLTEDMQYFGNGEVNA